MQEKLALITTVLLIFVVGCVPTKANRNKDTDWRAKRGLDMRELMWAGDYRAAEGVIREDIARSRRENDDLGVAAQYLNLSVLKFKMGERDQAKDALRRSYELSQLPVLFLLELASHPEMPQDDHSDLILECIASIGPDVGVIDYERSRRIYARLGKKPPSEVNIPTDSEIASYEDAKKEQMGFLGDKWAFIVGLSEYRNIAGGLSSLVYADDDAKSFADSLKRLGWNDSHIKLLTNEKATK